MTVREQHPLTAFLRIEAPSARYDYDWDLIREEEVTVFVAYQVNLKLLQAEVPENLYDVLAAN